MSFKQKDKKPNKGKLKMQYDNENENTKPTYQVFVTEMKWNKTSSPAFRSKYSSKRELPSDMTFDIPDEKYQRMLKTNGSFNDEVETYIYDTLTRKFGYELNRCQIWLPLD